MNRGVLEHAPHSLISEALLHFFLLMMQIKNTIKLTLVFPTLTVNKMFKNRERQR